MNYFNVHFARKIGMESHVPHFYFMEMLLHLTSQIICFSIGIPMLDNMKDANCAAHIGVLINTLEDVIARN